MKCKVNIGRETFDGEFMGLFQYSEVVAPSPMIGGHTGGVVSYPVAVVKVGRFLKQVRATSVHFEEEEPVDYISSFEEFVTLTSSKGKTVLDVISDMNAFSNIGCKVSEFHEEEENK